LGDWGIGELANGVVSVNAYGILDGTPLPLAFRVDKPESRLKPGDIFKSKPQLAVELIQELQAPGLRFSVVLADSMHGERWDFTHAVHHLDLLDVVAIRSIHAVWLPPGEHQRDSRGHTVDRLFADGTSTPRCMREVVFGRRNGSRQRCFQITADPVRQPPDTT
jgi:SRSO17 transposase